MDWVGLGWDELGWQMDWEMGWDGMNWVGKWVGMGWDELVWEMVWDEMG